MGVSGKEAANHVASKVARSELSCVISSIALLKSSDSKCGALNDTAFSQYAQIEGEPNVATFKRGNSMLHDCNWITQARKITNDFVKYILDIKHYPDCEQGDLVAIETEHTFHLSCRG